MKTKAVRLYGKQDLRFEEFELPEIKDNEILAHIISDSLCLSSYKAAMQGEDHKRVPANISTNPIIIGHEICGEIVEVGSKWQGKFKPTQKFTVQTAINYMGTLDAPGYSFPYIGGDATYVIIPHQFMELNCLLPYEGDTFFYGSLAEPMSCIVGGFHANYHTDRGSYVHKMGIVKGGKMAMLAGAGPMGLGSIDYAIHCDRKPSLLVITDIDTERLKRAAEILTVEEAAKNGVRLIYVNTAEITDVSKYLLDLTNGTGYDDVFVYAPISQVVEQGDKILGYDGCLNFFAGPVDPNFNAKFNFYNAHYATTHITGTSGGNTDDMLESISMMEKGLLNPAAMITHIGGLDTVAEATLNLNKIPGGKKLIYTNISLELTAIIDFEVKGKTNQLFKMLDSIVKRNNCLWCKEAEDYLLKNAKSL